MPALPTRDALLPIFAVLATATAQKTPISELAASLPARVMKAARLKEITPTEGNRFVAEMAASPHLRATFAPMLATPQSVNTADGTRLTLDGGTIVHFRQSGNAPELRCYVETGTAEATDTLLEDMMDRLARHFGQDR